MPKEWYISFHGGEEKSALNNIHVYSAEGEKLRKALNKKSVTDDVKLRELRGFVFGPDKNLYVVNAYFEYSEILKFKGALNKDGQHDFIGVFTKRHPNPTPGVDPPFTRFFILKAIFIFRLKKRTLLRVITVPPAREDNRDYRCLCRKSLSPTPACRMELSFHPRNIWPTASATLE